MSELHTLEVTLEAEEIASHTDETGSSTLYLVENDRYYVHWQDDEQAWLETGAPGMGVSVGVLRALFPELAEGLEA